MRLEERPSLLASIAIAPHRGANRGRGAYQASVLAALVAALLSACATGDAPRPADPGDVRPGGPQRRDTLAVGERIPDFEAPALGGGVVRWQDREGTPTVLVIWASWCPHCQRLLPLLVRVARDYPIVRLLTVTTSIGRHGGPSPAEFVARGPTFPVALDDTDNSLARALGVFRYPTVYWIGRDGTVRGVSEGEATDTELHGAFDALLAGP